MVCVAILITILIVMGVKRWVYYYKPIKIDLTPIAEIYTPGATGRRWKIIFGRNREAINESWGIEIPEIDFDKNYLLLSDGRKMQELTYTRISQHQWCYDVPKGIAAFGDEYYHNTVFVYKMEKILLKQEGD